MTEKDYPIYANDDSVILIRRMTPEGKIVLEDTKGKKSLPLDKLIEQACNPQLAKKRRGKQRCNNTKMQE